MSVLVERDTGSSAPSHYVLLQNDAATVLGRLRLGGLIRKGRGVEPRRPLRVYGSYAVILILNGNGLYRDAAGVNCAVHAGDVITVFPERAHWYGPRGAAHWDELYVTFDGPLFDLFRQARILDDRIPVTAAPAEWRNSLWGLLVEPAQQTPVTPPRHTHVQQIVELAGLLLKRTQFSEAGPQAKGDLSEPDVRTWVSQARLSLDIELSRRLDMDKIASEAGVSYEQFRKRFQREVGVSPARYRMQRRIEIARELLRYSPQITNRQAAETLGFSDEFHFSRRFTEITGSSPREFRRAAVAGVAIAPIEAHPIQRNAAEPGAIREKQIDASSTQAMPSGAGCCGNTSTRGRG